MKTTLTLSACLLGLATAIDLVNFQASNHAKFIELNDPVMGGKSTGTWSIDASGKFGIFDGEVVVVPALKASGFIKTASDGTFADVSGAGSDGNVVLMVRSSTPEYTGFRVAFAAGTVSPSYACGGGGSLPFSRGCFKADFRVPVGSEFTAVTIPLTEFSDMWSPASGDHTKNCTDDSSVCPSSSSLKGIKRVELWAEGVAGKVHLEVASISVAPSSSSLVSALEVEANPSKVPSQYNKCSATVQDNLKYNISTRTSSMYFPDEGMAAAVCCDSRMASLAEPQFTFAAPDIMLFSELDKNTGVTTFYDSVCGIPVFRAPVNRTLAEFEADTNEHGWPSFRPEEVVTENVITNVTDPTANGPVQSKCGTHLGSYLPDGKGPRWCIDLSCIAGNKA